VVVGLSGKEAEFGGNLRLQGLERILERFGGALRSFDVRSHRKSFKLTSVV
jgi:hypothetical protein